MIEETKTTINMNNTGTLKNLRTIMLIIAIVGLIAGLMIPASAGNDRENTNRSDCDYYLNDNVDLIKVESDKNPIKIIDQNETLVAEGTEDSKLIQKYIGVSDFLLEVNNIRYYRISYQESLTLNRKMAIQ